MSNKFEMAGSEDRLGSKAFNIAETAMYISEIGGLDTIEKIKKATPYLEKMGIDVTADYVSKCLGNKNMASLASPSDSAIGSFTFAINDQLIQDYSPDDPMTNSPFNDILPIRSFDEVLVQQDFIGSLYGWADGDAGAMAGKSVVPLLRTYSNQYRGFQISEYSEISGNDLYALRKVGTSKTSEVGRMQKLNYSTLNLYHRMLTGIELNRIEAVTKGSWTWSGESLADGSATPPTVVGVGIPTSNIINLTSQATYNPNTRVLKPNTYAQVGTLSTNPLDEIALGLTPIINAGLTVESLTMDNITYSAIFLSNTVTARTQYFSAVAGNNIMTLRDNVFKYSNIPQLQGVSIEVDSRSIKTDGNLTSIKNTQPIRWGKTIDSNSFNIIVKVKNKNLSRIGDFGFFPNLYARNSSVYGGSVSNKSMGAGGNITMITQDLSQMNALNQKIQMFCSSNSAPMPYLTNMLYLMTGLVTISST